MRAAAATVRLPRAPRVTVQVGARARRRLLVATVVGAALAALYLGWFRDSSFVRVENVSVAGLPATGGAHLRAELTAAALRMTTLDVDTDALRTAVARDPIVRSLSASGDFPNTLRIDVVVNVPVATLSAGGRTVAAASDGTLLRGVPARAVPSLRVRSLPRGAQLRDRRTLGLLAVAAAAPQPLRRLLDTVDTTPGRGLVARLRGGPEVVFGDAAALAAKWAAAAAVLAQSSAAGATYVDVHDPRDPIAAGVTLPDGPLSAAQPNGPGAGPGVVDATPTNATPGQATPAAGASPAGAGVAATPVTTPAAAAPTSSPNARP